ncbi:DsbA family protein [Frigidibacter sp. MR17.14]|uniref:DsbA family protein n=1 Tax=Frigidibacter sp. MR17.14 TaxID=3126509 RepID=UPI003012C9A8
MQRRTFTLALLTTALVGGGSWIARGLGLGQTQIPAGAAFAQDAADAPIREDMVMGKADAPVTVIEYASFTCPHCQHWHETVWPEFKKNYIDTGKVKFILREVYFDKFGLWAGMVAQCGGEMRYYGMVDMIYDQQKEWIGSGQPTEIADNLRKIGAKAGLSKDQIDACLNDKALAQSMVATYQKNATADGVDATPTFFVNGTKHSNMDYEEFAKVLDEALG